MKLIRLTEDRYVFDAGPDATAEQVARIGDWWKNWWETETEVPTVMVLGRVTEPLEYEDRRASDIEKRLAELEAAIKHHKHGPSRTV